MPVRKPIVSFPPLAWGEGTGLIQWHNERCIEIPLSQSLLDLRSPGRILDAGCSVNGVMHPEMPAEVTHVTLSLREEPIFPGHRHYVEADLRDLSPFPDQAFDRTACISTLEHVGMDNATYGAPVEADPGSVVQAVRELYRVTKDLLFITVPFREAPLDCGRWRYFTPETLQSDLCTQFPTDRLKHRTLAYYAEHKGCWSGPFDKPQAVDGDGHKVQQIVCLLLT